jgi:hypothetical protein
MVGSLVRLADHDVGRHRDDTNSRVKMVVLLVGIAVEIAALAIDTT